MTNECIPLDILEDFVSRDKNIIAARIREALVRKAVYTNTLKTGKLGNQSDVLRVVVQERAAMASSKVEPEFFDDIDQCNSFPVRDRMGTTEYTMTLGSLRGAGPDICVKKSRTAFMQSYDFAQKALQQGIYEIINYDIRRIYFRRSGIKFVVDSTHTFDENLTGDQYQVDTPFSPWLPDSPPTFKLVAKLKIFLQEEMLADPYEMQDGQEVYMVIGASSMINRFRNEVGVREDLRALTAGSFKVGEKDIRGYVFKGPYQELAFGVDQQPIRYNELDANGQPITIEPEIKVQATNGLGVRRNPAWVNARYEIMFILGSDHFERLVPETYTGEGKMKFDLISYSGELEWHYARDNCDWFGDRGRFIYEIRRAFKPVRPHSVIAVAYQRCTDDLGIEPCTFLSSTNGL